MALEHFGDVYLDKAKDWTVKLEDGTVAKKDISGGKNHPINAVTRYEDFDLIDITFVGGFTIVGFDPSCDGYVLGNPVKSLKDKRIKVEAPDCVKDCETKEDADEETTKEGGFFGIKK